MAKRPPLTKPYRLVLPDGLNAELQKHLFPGDQDEHGAVILAGLAETAHEVRLLAREVHLAEDGQDYVPGQRGYRMLRAEFITRQVLKARNERLVYLAVHNHEGTDQVAFSGDDLRSHERGYPALLQIVRGMPVGALVFAKNAIAGDIWMPSGGRVPLKCAVVIGRRRQVLTPSPIAHNPRACQRYNRQVRLFGDRGQAILDNTKVAIIGLGGVGSLIAELIGRLGVGRFVLIDPDRAEWSNLPRLVGARKLDAAPTSMAESSWPWMRSLARMLSKNKTSLAERNIQRANPKAAVETLASDISDPEIAKRHLVDCDFIFLAADTMTARNVFNALVHQYLIPGVQMGAKVVPDKDGNVSQVYAITRLITPDAGCLQCNGLINAAKLQDESLSKEERRRQRYVDDEDVIAPSVITLNATTSAQAANDFLFYMTGLSATDATLDYIRYQPTCRKFWKDKPAQMPACLDCSRTYKSRFARGDSRGLPVKLSRAKGLSP